MASLGLISIEMDLTGYMAFLLQLSYPSYICFSRYIIWISTKQSKGSEMMVATYVRIFCCFTYVYWMAFNAL